MAFASMIFNVSSSKPLNTNKFALARCSTPFLWQAPRHSASQNLQVTRLEISHWTQEFLPCKLTHLHILAWVAYLVADLVPLCVEFLHDHTALNSKFLSVHCQKQDYDMHTMYTYCRICMCAQWDSRLSSHNQPLPLVVLSFRGLETWPVAHWLLLLRSDMISIVCVFNVLYLEILFMMNDIIRRPLGKGERAWELWCQMRSNGASNLVMSRCVCAWFWGLFL